MNNKQNMNDISPEYIVSNIRSEIGDLILLWVLLQQSIRFQNHLAEETESIDKTSFTPSRYFQINEDRYSDELIARLSELSKIKNGQATFHFANTKFLKFEKDILRFRKYVIENKFTEARNKFISHKELALDWDHTAIKPYINYRQITKALAFAIKIQKKLDAEIFGPAAKYMWYETRKRRYQFYYPAGTFYTVMPYINLDAESRIKIFLEERAQGKENIDEIETLVDGEKRIVLCNKQWGLLLINEIVPLDVYPLRELHSINTK